MNKEAIAVLSDIRSSYNCFDLDEEPKYRALSMAIDALKNARRVSGFLPKWVIRICMNALYVKSEKHINRHFVLIVERRWKEQRNEKDY